MTNALLRHPFWAVTDPEKFRLVRIYQLPDSKNPFAESGVVFKAAAVPGEAPYHKASMARYGLLEAVQQGLVKQSTILVEASSGNTGHALAVLCNALGLKLVLIVPGDIPQEKITAIRVFGNVEVRLHYDKAETTVECARRLGAQEGWYNLDQYRGDWNAASHALYLAPQLFKQGPVSLFVAPAGTMGTCLGVERYVRAVEIPTKVVPVVCEPGQEVPAVRTLARIKRDVRTGWEDVFGEADFESAKRHESFLLSHGTWSVLPVQLGPSFGLALAGAMEFVRRHQEAGTLGQFRNGGGKITVMVLGPDSSHPYHPLYLSELTHDELSGHAALPDLFRV